MNAQIFTWENPNLKDSLKPDSILASKIEKDVFFRDTLHFIKTPSVQIADDAVLVKNQPKKFFKGINSQGAIIRGITFGNNQGSAVQSSMDLQISGQLSKDVSIIASLSDHNLPIQADGYTQTLNEFDKIYIQLNIKQNSILRAGYLDLDNDQIYFGRYQRRSMGLRFQTKLGQSNQTYLDLSAGVARSEFQRIRFQGREGNQGPYRLTGKNGETFVTVISGSEQVYIDGLLMKRGENQDYTINYNTGEVTFTSFRPIYQQNFITISYNYTNRNYTRFLVTGGVGTKKERFNFGVNWFLENDNKTSPLSLNLSEEDQAILAKAGNDPTLMMAPSAQLTDYDVNKVLYRKIIRGQDEVFEYSANPDDQLYQVAFTYFGDGKGDYKILQNGNNGRILQYVGPNMGDYAALRQLPAPQKTQVFSAHADYDINNGTIGTDFSFSNFDRNVFSSLNNKDNFGYAGRIYGTKIFKKNQWTGVSNLEYQHINEDFHILDRINDVEFSRDFNLNQEFNHRTQNRLVFGISNQWEAGSSLNYKFNYLDERNFYSGLKNDLDFSWNQGIYRTYGMVSFLKTSSEVQKTEFTKASLQAERLSKKGSWTLGASLEHNIKKYEGSKQWDANSFRWQEAFIQKKIGDSTRTHLLTKVYFRNNDSIRAQNLVKVNHLVGIMAESELLKSENTRLNVVAHYRKFFYTNVSENKNQDFLIGNVMYNQNFFNKGMRLQAFYELGNGQEAQREFHYIKVADGQGIYKWTDYNGDNIQQIDEFETAEYADHAQFIRIYTNTIRYLPSNKNKFTLAIFANPAVVLNSQNRFLNRWNLNVSFNSQNSFLKKNNVIEFNPFLRSESQILKSQSLLILAQLNSTDQSGWNGNYRFITNDNLINANFSKETNNRASHFLNVGYWFNKNLRADWENTLTVSSNTSELFKARNYSLEEVSTTPKLTYKFSAAIQSELSASLKNNRRTDGVEKLNAINLYGALQWSKKQTSIRGSFAFINNHFSGNAFSVVGNQMLNGLKPNKNEVWNVYLEHALNNYIDLNFNYEGRNSGERTIHIGSMQVKASF